MKKLAFVLSAIAVGALLGYGAAWRVIAGADAIGGVNNNGWRTSAVIGSTDADPYTRAIVARAGLLALNQEETVYYTRMFDEAGRAFDELCVYLVEGAALPARWWSLTLYAEDHFLAVNGEERHSVDATGVERDESDAWAVRVAPTQAGARNWISSRNGGAFSLSIRLYNPDAEVRETLAGVALPRVSRESCGEGA